MDDRSRRAEAAREKILASGNPDLINQLHLMEAAQARPAPAASTGPQGWLGGMATTGLAVAGGAWLGTSLAHLSLSADMEAAFAAVAEDLGLGPDAAQGMYALPEVHDAATDDGFFGDLGLDDLFDI